MNYNIKANQKGTRTMEISDSHLRTIREYTLFSDLLDSNGIVDESVLDKLRLNVRHMLGSGVGGEKLLTLCNDVLFNDNMKAFALHQLISLYLYWEQREGGQTDEPHSQAD